MEHSIKTMMKKEPLYEYDDAAVDRSKTTGPLYF